MSNTSNMGVSGGYWGHSQPHAGNCQLLTMEGLEDTPSTHIDPHLAERTSAARSMAGPLVAAGAGGGSEPRHFVRCENFGFKQ